MTFAGRLESPGERTELTLELARRSHEPAAADKTRNLAALRGRLGLPTPVSSSPPGGAPLPQPIAASSGARALGLAPWQQLLAVGALTGALGFFLGLGVGDRANQAPSASAARAGSAAAPLQRALAPMAAPQSDARVEPAVVGAPAEQPVPTAGTSDVGSVSAPSRATKARRAVARGARAPEPSDPDFLEAVQLLSRSRRALDRQEPSLALSLLDELDARFAPQLLDEERAATRVLSLCARGEQPAALALARSWFSARPRSIYTRRLEQSCAREALSTSSH